MSSAGSLPDSQVYLQATDNSYVNTHTLDEKMLLMCTSIISVAHWSGQKPCQPGDYMCLTICTTLQTYR